MSHSERVNWREFFADSLIGDSFIADAQAKASAVASAKRYGIKLRCRKNDDGKYICRIIEATSERQRILAGFAALPIENLKALYKAANQFGLIKT